MAKAIKFLKLRNKVPVGLVPCGVAVPQMIAQVLHRVQGLVYLLDRLQTRIIVEVFLQLWILDVRVIGHAIETLSRIPPVAIGLEAVKPRVPHLDSVVVILVFLFLGQDRHLKIWVLL